MQSIDPQNHLTVSILKYGLILQRNIESTQLSQMFQSGLVDTMEETLYNSKRTLIFGNGYGWLGVEAISKELLSPENIVENFIKAMDNVLLP